MLVWAHHMFTVGLPIWLNAFFLVSSLAVAIPTAVKIFNWLATLWRGKLDLPRAAPLLPRLHRPLHDRRPLGDHHRAFPFDYQAHDSYYIVAHLHYVLFGGTVFGVLAGTHYWFPKITGRMYDERLGKARTSGSSSSGSTRRSSPAHARAHGHAARVYTYSAEGLFEAYNLTPRSGPGS